MSIMTPNAKGHEHLGALASRYVDVASLPWVPTRFKGVDLKVLMEDKETGLMTASDAFRARLQLPDHEHTELEQSYVLEGRSPTRRVSPRPATTSGVRLAVATMRIRPTAPSCFRSS